MSAINADRIAELGVSFGARMLVALDALTEAAYEGGTGMNWRAEADLFEASMDTFSDALREKVGDDAADLFEVEARLTWYGIQATQQQISKWRDQSWRAQEALSKMEAA